MAECEADAKCAAGMAARSNGPTATDELVSLCVKVTACMTVACSSKVSEQLIRFT